MIARHWLRQPVGLPPRLLPGNVGLDNRRLRVAHDGGTARARHSSPLLLWLLLLDGLAAEGRRLGDCYADIGTSMPYAASPGCWSTTGSAGAVIHGRSGGEGNKVKTRWDPVEGLETTHERRGSMGRVKCSRRGGTTTDNDGDGVCGRRGLYVFLSGNLGSRGGRGGDKAGRKHRAFFSKMPGRIQNQHPLPPRYARLVSPDPWRQSETPTGERAREPERQQAGSGRERGVA